MSVMGKSCDYDTDAEYCIRQAGHTGKHEMRRKLFSDSQIGAAKARAASVSEHPMGEVIETLLNTISDILETGFTHEDASALRIAITTALAGVSERERVLREALERIAELDKREYNEDCLGVGAGPQIARAALYVEQAHEN